MISFGIDPGSQRTGWGAVVREGSRLSVAGYGVLRVEGELSDRLEAIFEGLLQQLSAVRPDAVFVESVFHHKNARSALVLGQARGVALLAARRAGPGCAEISPAEVKKAVTGRGRADKEQVQQMIRVLLGLAELPPTDAADALAIAVAGATRSTFAEAVELAQRSPR